MKEKEISEIVKGMAKRIDIVRLFDDVVIIDMPELQAIGGVNSKTNELFINVGNTVISHNELMKCLSGFMVHEAGHIDKRLGVYGTKEILESHQKKLKKRKLDNENGKWWLNFVYDMEIHYNYSTKRRFIKAKKSMELNEFLTVIRNKLFQTDPDDIVLSLSYPHTPQQKLVKKIIENRDLSVVEKVIKLAKNRKMNEPQKKGGQSKDDNKKERGNKGEGKGNGKPKEKGKQGRKAITFLDTESDSESDEFEDNEPEGNPQQQKAVRVKARVIEEDDKRQIGERLQVLGLSTEEIGFFLTKRDCGETIVKINNLEESFKNIMPQLDSLFGKEKTMERTKNIGLRMNGFKRIKDVSEITQNVEDMVTVGEYDINEIRVPYHIDRKTKGNMIILRDVSGSVSQPPFDKLMRDITVTLISLAKEKHHNVGVIDFHTFVEPIFDNKRNILTDKYNILLLESMGLKWGSSTLLSKAIEYVNTEIFPKYPETKFTIFIVTDGIVDFNSHIESQCRFMSKEKVDVRGIVVGRGNVHTYFEDLMGLNKGKIYKIDFSNEKQITAELLKDFKVGA